MVSTVDGAGDGSSGIRGLQNKTGLLLVSTVDGAGDGSSGVHGLQNKTQDC